ncbi:nucleoside hydrolase [Amaricoccus solimangrovi]|uniref:Nucleoside hydrolase n=1 Tax=Amaricoccus solimangrovi TaxID=2589815 RepID=A0A501X0C6_9RHOB|nr:nucleoside hydrolase [Amaricoccus solimangrovi]TPE52076.1 nucleoside hydrolase [Amaricoccus solimangrovi]
MTSAPRKIIIDTDPGQDDAIAILLALASPELEVLGLTAVAGNVPLALTERNARRICELAGRSDLAVHAGAARPLSRKLVTAEAVHGRTGLDGPDLPEPVMPLRAAHAADFIVETLRREEPGAVTLCTLGPLTNVALAFAKAPEIVPRVREIVTMGGGAFEGGNTTPVAEFNILVDPHAAKAVLGAAGAAGVPVTMMPLDVTHKALTRADRIAAIRDLRTPVGDAVVALLEFFERFDEAKYGTDGGPLHDPCVIAWLLAPGIFGGGLVNVEIETGSELTMGQTVVDWWGVTTRPRNVRFIREIDADAFFSLLTERIGRLPREAGPSHP